MRHTPSLKKHCITQTSDAGPMHGLFDHEPVFSAVVWIIFQTGWAIACGMELRYLPNECKTAWTRRTNDGQLQSHRNEQILEDCR